MQNLIDGGAELLMLPLILETDFPTQIGSIHGANIVGFNQSHSSHQSPSSHLVHLLQSLEEMLA